MAIDFKKAARALNRQLKELPEWVQQEDTNGMPEFARKGMAGYVTGGASIGDASVGLTYFGSYYGMKGCVQVLAGDERGFAELDRGLLYDYWSIRLVLHAYDADTRPDKQPRVNMDYTATCWMHAASLGTRDILDWLTERIRKVDAGDGGIGGKKMNALCALMAHFATGREVRALEGAGWAPIGAYGVVTGLRSQHYDELADYHMQRITGDDFPEFQSNPYCVIPFELLAIERLTGVRIENPKHPLLTSPLVRRRDVAEIPMTDELGAIIAKAKTEFPI